MNVKRIVAVCSCLVLASCTSENTTHPNADSPQQALESIRVDRIRAAMSFLADDALEGRGTATRGSDIAARYVASQFEAMGLQPAGDRGSYLQSVPLRQGAMD